MLVVLVCAWLGWAKDLHLEERLEAVDTEMRRAVDAPPCDQCGCMAVTTHASSRGRQAGTPSCCGAAGPNGGGSWKYQCGTRNQANNPDHPAQYSWPDGRNACNNNNAEQVCDGLTYPVDTTTTTVAP